MNTNQMHLGRAANLSEKLGDLKSVEDDLATEEKNTSVQFDTFF